MKFLFLFCALFILCAESLFSQSLSLRIHADNQTVLESQSLWVTLSLKNTGKKEHCFPENILYPGSKNLILQLSSKEGNPVKQLSNLWKGSTGLSPNDCIKPKDSLMQSFDILGFFYNTGAERTPSYASTLHYLSSGSYSFSATIINGKDTLRSNTIRFTVSKPGASELHALKALKEAEPLIGSDNEKAITLLRQMIQRYPSSAYTPQAYGHLISLYHNVKRDTKKSLETVIELAKNFPDNGRAAFALSTYSSFLLKERMRKSISMIAQSYPNTKAGKKAKEILAKK